LDSLSSFSDASLPSFSPIFFHRDSPRAFAISFPHAPFIIFSIPCPDKNALEAFFAFASDTHLIPLLSRSLDNVSDKDSIIFFSVKDTHSFMNVFATPSAPSAKIDLTAVLPTVLSPSQRAVLAPIHAGAAAHQVTAVIAANPTSIQAPCPHIKSHDFAPIPSFHFKLVPAPK